jgi:hypothetical protein
MTLIATDLDRTLVFSERFVSTRPTATPVCDVELYQGRNISLMAREVRDSLALLAKVHDLIPTTTRTRAQLRRIDLGFPAAHEICCSGGVVLHDDLPDEDWAATLASLVAAECMPYAEAEAGFAPWAGQTWMRQLRDAEGIFLIASVDAVPRDEVEALTETFVEGNWRVVHQGSKVYALPRVVTKSAAVSYLQGRLGGEVWAAGDSVLDWDMLAHAARAWTSADGELVSTGRTAEHLQVTQALGLDASVEIVRAWCALSGLGAPTVFAGPSD